MSKPRKPHTKLRRWMNETCTCGLPMKLHGDTLDQGHRPLTLKLLSDETKVPASTLMKLSAMKGRGARVGTVALLKMRYPNCPIHLAY